MRSRLILAALLAVGLALVPTLGTPHAHLAAGDSVHAHAHGLGLAHQHGEDAEAVPAAGSQQPADLAPGSHHGTTLATAPAAALTLRPTLLLRPGSDRDPLAPAVLGGAPRKPGNPAPDRALDSPADRRLPDRPMRWARPLRAPPAPSA